MKATHLLATLVAVTLPLAAVTAEDSSRTETTGQNYGMLYKTQMMSQWKDQDAELGKLVAEMNRTPADKKVDAVAAVLTKVIEQRLAIHEQMRKMMSANEKEGMGMCRMMMGMDMGCDKYGEHLHHQ